MKGSAGMRLRKIASAAAVVGVLLAVAVGTAPHGGSSSAAANGSYQDPPKLTQMGLRFVTQPAPSVLPPGDQ